MRRRRRAPRREGAVGSGVARRAGQLRVLTGRARAQNDLAEALSVDELIERMNLKTISNREVCCYSISAKNSVNIDITLDWLMKHSQSAR